MLSALQLHCFHRPEEEGVPRPRGEPDAQLPTFASVSLSLFKPRIEIISTQLQQ